MKTNREAMPGIRTGNERTQPAEAGSAFRMSSGKSSSPARARIGMVSTTTAGGFHPGERMQTGARDRCRAAVDGSRGTQSAGRHD